MKHLKQRNLKIVNEIMSFFYKNGANKIHIDLSTLGNETEFLFWAEIESLDKHSLDIAERLLNSPRCHEMEEYYWSLTGDSDTDNELTLVGMMTDETEINYKDNKILEIKLKRRI